MWTVNITPVFLALSCLLGNHAVHSQVPEIRMEFKFSLVLQVSEPTETTEALYATTIANNETTEATTGWTDVNGTDTNTTTPNPDTTTSVENKETTIVTSEETTIVTTVVSTNADDDNVTTDGTTLEPEPPSLNATETRAVIDWLYGKYNRTDPNGFLNLTEDMSLESFHISAALQSEIIASVDYVVKYLVTYDARSVNHVSLIREIEKIQKEIANGVDFPSALSGFSVDSGATSSRNEVEIQDATKTLENKDKLCYDMECGRTETCITDENGMECIGKCDLFNSNTKCAEDGVLAKGECYLDTETFNPQCNCSKSLALENFFDGNKCINTSFLVGICVGGTGLLLLILIITICWLSRKNSALKSYNDGDRVPFTQTTGWNSDLFTPPEVVPSLKTPNASQRSLNVQAETEQAVASSRAASPPSADTAASEADKASSAPPSSPPPSVNMQQEVAAAAEEDASVVPEKNLVVTVQQPPSEYASIPRKSHSEQDGDRRESNGDVRSSRPFSYTKPNAYENKGYEMDPDYDDKSQQRPMSGNMDDLLRDYADFTPNLENIDTHTSFQIRRPVVMTRPADFYQHRPSENRRY